jgi:hypothetical protein
MHRSQSFDSEETYIDERLIEAAEAGELKQVNILLIKGADVNYIDTDHGDYTPLTRAVENDRVDVVRRLLQEDDIDISLQVTESEDAIGGNALHIAAFRGYDEIVRMLLAVSREDINTQEYCGYTPLHETIMNGQVSTFKLLLNLGASHEEPTEDGGSTTTTPEGLDALGLIMHELMTENTSTPFELIQMLVYLVRNYEVEMPRKRLFREDTDFYALVADNIDNHEILYKELLQFFDIPDDRLKRESLNGALGDYHELSDSDSEDEMDYQFNDKFELHREAIEKKIEENFPKDESPTLIPHFRGVHFYPRYFNREGRRLERELADEQAKGVMLREPIFCDATHELAKISYQLPESDNVNNYSRLLSERTEKLTAQSEKVASAVRLMQSQKNVEPCLIKSNRERYASRYHEYIQRYVNSYAALKKDMEKAKEIDPSTIKSKTEKEKFILLKKFNFTKLPFVSTTEDDHWAFEYALSLVSYDKQTTFRPTTNSAIQPLRPCYLPDGKPRFPYLGIVYATLHTTEELDDGNSERILDLFAENSIDTRCAAPGGHVTGGYIRAKERVFVNAIDAKRIFVGVVVRVPNLSLPYQAYMEDKYGLTEQEYNKFKAVLLKTGSYDSQTLKLRNENQYFRVQLKIIEKVIAHQEARLLEFLSSCARNKNFQLKMFGSTTDELIDPSNRDAKEEKVFIKQFVDLRKQSSSSLYKEKEKKRELEPDIEKSEDDEKQVNKRQRKK